MIPIMSLRLPVLHALFVALSAAPACGDDAQQGSGGGGASDPSTTSATSSPASTSSSTTATTATSASGATTGTGGDSATGTGGAGGDGGAGGEGIGGAGGSGGAPGACLTADALDALQEHLDAMSASAQQLAGHGGASEATGFLAAPGLPAPPAVTALFATLIAPCDGEAFEYAPYCDEEGACSRIGCTGEGAGWTMTTWAEDAREADGFVIDLAEVVHAWADGATTTDVTITVIASGPEGRDWSFVGAGVFAEDGLELDYAFDAWVAGLPTTMTWSVEQRGATLGEIRAGDVVVAEIGDDGHFALTGECPP
jgi:hypothetical protein